MQSTNIKKRSVHISGHYTSVTLEEEYWSTLKEIAWACGKGLSKLISEINENRQSNNLSSAIRLFILQYYRDQLQQQTLVTKALSLDRQARVQ